MITNKGLCSVTFRNLGVQEIISIVKESGLNCIEWGGDIHAKPNDINNAKQIAKLMSGNGLKIFSYGSYYRCENLKGFIEVSETAKALGAKIIRIWAGVKNAEDYTTEEFDSLVTMIKECSSIAEKNGQIIAFEYHQGTYNNSSSNSLRLIKEIEKENVKTYWQPMYWNEYKDEQEEIDCNINSIKDMYSYIVCTHIYNWSGNSERLTLKSGIKKWREYAKILPDCYGYLEFVKNDSEKQFLQDAKYINKI